MTWYIVKCLSGHEGRAERFLERLGYPHGWHPTEKVRLPEKLYLRALERFSRKGGPKPQRHRISPVVTGYVFVPADCIDWRAIKENPFGEWMEVLTVAGAPYVISDEAMMKMRSIPDRLAEMVKSVEDARRKAWEAKRPIVGQEAMVVDGLFKGKKGPVEEIHGEMVRIDVGGYAGPIDIPQHYVERAA